MWFYYGYRDGQIIDMGSICNGSHQYKSIRDRKKEAGRERRRRGKRKRQGRRNKDEEEDGDMWRLGQTGVMWPPNKEIQQPTEGEDLRDGASLDSLEGTQACWCLHLTPISAFRPLKMKENKFLLLKSSKFVSFVALAFGKLWLSNSTSVETMLEFECTVTNYEKVQCQLSWDLTRRFWEEAIWISLIHQLSTLE